MDLDKYKQRLREEILEVGNSNGVRKTCREAGISLGSWQNIRLGEHLTVETLEKYLSKIKNSLDVIKN